MHRRKKYGQQFSGGVTIISVLFIVLAMCAVARGGIKVTRKKLVVCVGEEGTAELVTTIPDDPRTKEEKQGQREEPTIDWEIAEDDGTDAQVTGNGDSADFSVESDDPGYYDSVVEVTISWPCAPGTGSVPDTVYSTTLTLTAIGIKDPLQYKRHWYVSSEDVTGTIYMALGGTVYFKANPDPDSADFPDGRPEWYVARGSEAEVEQETTGQRYTFSKDADGNPWTAGTYTIRAACGESSRSATVVVVEIARIACANQAGTVVKRSEATTDSEIGDGQTVFAPPNTTVTLTAVPDPACDDTEWLGDNLSWVCPALLINEAEQPDAPDQWAFKSDTVGDYVVTAKLGTSERKMQISVVTPKVFSIQFEGDITIHHDVTGAAYSGVDWQDDDLDGTAEATEMPDANADDSKHYHPIAYQSRATLAIDAGNLVFQLDKGDAASRIPYDIVGVAQVKFCPDTSWYDLFGDWSTPGELDVSGVNISNSDRLTAAAPFED
ncbi:MAG: hypothetical protein U9Q79_06245, partial [Candidatus Hydrogenedentes bacterium]|nr:hypothetical protein [Candidatus Hydrogenedentota bacterium]